MKKHIIAKIWLCLVLVVFSSLIFPNSIARGEYIGPGIYNGYLAKDRWDRYFFHKGPYHLLLSDDAAKDLENFTGKPLEINVKQMVQPINPGGATIKTVQKVAVKGSLQGLKLSIGAAEKRVPQGKGIKLRLSVQNKSKKPEIFLPGTLALCVVTQKPFSNDKIGYKGKAGRAYWYYSYTFFRHNTFDNPQRIACHRIILPLTGKEIVAKGKGLRLVPKEQGYKGPLSVDAEAVSFHDGSVIIEPGGAFSTEYIVGRELLTGEYEIFLYLTSGNFSYPASPMSGRLSFDVFKAQTGKK